MKFTKDFLETMLQSVKDGGSRIELVLELRYDVTYDQFELRFREAKPVRD
jgi:hypothetical protein